MKKKKNIYIYIHTYRYIKRTKISHSSNFDVEIVLQLSSIVSHHRVFSSSGQCAEDHEELNYKEKTITRIEG